ncbi:N-6 DNA methylase [Nocardia brevicatena]|uniref:N-6 DNA methylase n=1 Tax=Nocardia brevicatena TaxID=37327 RepID=UPI0002ED588A|nr:N-6 DNA methylase [Nocardia brevicatena]
MSDTASLVTAAEISRLAGVTRATVSNWRRRHPDFPSPAGGSESRPVFDLGDVREWLREHGIESAESPLRNLQTVLRAHVEPREIPRLLATLSPNAATLADPMSEGEPSEVLAAMWAAMEDAGMGATVEALAERGLEESPTTGVYVTPDEVAELMAELARATGVAVDRVLDPACGSGALLAAVARLGARECFAQDILPVQAQRAALNISLRARAVHVDPRAGDSLLADAFPGLEVDAVLCNPPNLQRDWGADELALDPRWNYGVPPRGESELAWVQHALAHLRPGGVAVLLLPPAVAFRSAGRRIRGELLRQGALRAVIGLPAGAAPPRQLGLHIWVLRNPATRDAGADEVLFVDAARLDSADEQGGPNALRKVSETVLAAWRAFDRSDSGAPPDVAAVVRVMDVLDEDVDLTPGRYVRAAVDADRTADAVAEGLAALEAEIDDLCAVFDDLPGFRGVGERAWRTATVADLAKGGALQVHLPRPRREESETSVDPHLGKAILTIRDLLSGGEPSGSVGSGGSASSMVIEPGDVVMPLLRGMREEHPGARVAGSAEAGALLGTNLFLLRPTPGRLDPWFLAGFVAAPENIAAGTVGATTVRVVPSRLRIPLLPPAQQQRYGAMFRQLHRLRASARRTDRSAARLAALIGTGLAAGALEPHDPPADDARTTSGKGRK